MGAGPVLSGPEAALPDEPVLGTARSWTPPSAPAALTPFATETPAGSAPTTAPDSSAPGSSVPESTPPASSPAGAAPPAAPASTAPAAAPGAPGVRCTSYSGGLTCVSDRGLNPGETMTFHLRVRAAENAAEGQIRARISAGTAVNLQLSAIQVHVDPGDGVDVRLSRVDPALAEIAPHETEDGPPTHLRLDVRNTGRNPGRANTIVELPDHSSALGVPPECALLALEHRLRCGKNLAPGESYTGEVYLLTVRPPRPGSGPPQVTVSADATLGRANDRDELTVDLVPPWLPERPCPFPWPGRELPEHWDHGWPCWPLPPVPPQRPDDPESPDPSEPEEPDEPSAPAEPSEPISPPRPPANLPVRPTEPDPVRPPTTGAPPWPLLPGLDDLPGLSG